MLFTDRRAAGRALAERLGSMAGERPIVIALPRGGVPVGREIADALGAPLEVLAVRKLGAPSHPEYGIGAVAEDGTGVVDNASARALDVSQAELSAIVDRESAELRRRVERYRGDRPATPVTGRTVVVVDDGAATGLTDLAAIRALRAQRRAARIVLALPVAARESLDMLGRSADDIVCLATPAPFVSVGSWYQDFAPVSDAEVVALLGGAPAAANTAEDRVVDIELAAGRTLLAGRLSVPAGTGGLVIFAHGSGSGRLSPRNVEVARRLGERGLATLLFDLLTEAEAARRANVFDIDLLAERLLGATRWCQDRPELAGRPVGYFGASTGAAAALVAAAEAGGEIGAVVSRGGRPDLAAGRLGAVTAATLLIVGGEDREVLRLNREAAGDLRCTSELVIVRGAGHLFEEPGALEVVATLAGDWFQQYLHPHAGSREILLTGAG